MPLQKQKTAGVMLQFDSPQARESFVSDLQKLNPGVARRARPAKSNPRVLTIDSLSSGDDVMVRELAKPNARVFEDVQMETFEEAN